MMEIMHHFNYFFLIALLCCFNSILFFLLNSNLKETSDLVEILLKPEAQNLVGLPDPEDEKRKKRWETIKKVAVGTVVVIGILVAGYFGIKYFGGFGGPIEPEVWKGPIITELDDFDKISANLPKSNTYIVDLGDGEGPQPSEQFQQNFNKFFEEFVESMPKEFIDKIENLMKNYDNQFKK